MTMRSALTHCRAGIAVRLCLLLAAGSGSLSVWAQDTPPAPDYSRGVKWFPKFWKAYEMPRVPAPNLGNGSQLVQMIRNGKIELSLATLNQLVEENSLDLISARYNVDIAQTDVLRSRSGQAARGAPGVPLPGEVFAAAVGAGVGAASTTNTGGVGPAAISAAARQVVIGPSGTFDPDFQISASFDHASSPLNTIQVAGVNEVSTPSSDLLTRFEKSFSTGFSFSVSFNSQRQSSTQRSLIYNPAYTSRLFLAAEQPLLNGFGKSVNRRFILIAENDVRISRELFRQQVMTALVNAQNAYWDLVAARKNVDAAQHALDTAEKLEHDTQQQEQAGVSAPLDVTTSRSATAGTRRDLIIAQTNEKTRELQLKALISKDLNSLSDIELTTTDTLPNPADADIPPVPDALRTARANRPELVQAEWGIRNQEITEKATRNGLKPRLNVFALYASSALGAGVGPMFNQAWTATYPEYAAGISLNIPLRNRSAQADNIRAKLELEQQRTQRTRAENQVDLDVQSAVIAMVQAKAQVQAAQQAVESSQAAFDAEQTRLSIGASTPYRVIQFQRDLVAAESAAIQAQANYAKARVQIDRVEGVVLQRNNISLDDLIAGRTPAASR